MFIIASVGVVATAVINTELRFTIDWDVSWIAAKLGVINLLINFLCVGFICIKGEFHIRLIPFSEIAKAFHVIRIDGIWVTDNFVCAFY